ncbi:MAG: hypothetical protein IJU57_04350 [Clostridia bacterium]|nr:hypothetical protein [Clostridia bacterium]
MVQEEISRTTLALMMRVGRFTERELMAAISNIGKGNGRKKEGTKPGRSKTYGELKTEAPVRLNIRESSFPKLIRAARRNDVSLEARATENGEIVLFVTGPGKKALLRFFDDVKGFARKQEETDMKRAVRKAEKGRPAQDLPSRESQAKDQETFPDRKSGPVLERAER